jgi:hypothetical protein
MDKGIREGREIEKEKTNTSCVYIESVCWTS